MKSLILVLVIISTTIWNIALAESARANDVLHTLPGHEAPIVTPSESSKAVTPTPIIKERFKHPKKKIKKHTIHHYNKQKSTKHI